MTSRAKARADRAPSAEPGKPGRWRRIRRWSLEIALGVAVYLGLSAWQERRLLDDGAAAPAFELRALSGERVHLGELRGKRVLLHFWATWCGVCRQEFGALNAVHDGLAEDEVLLSIVADSADVEHLRRFVRDHAIDYPVLLGTGAIQRAYRVGSFPTSYFIDERGVIVDRTVGMSTRWGLSARLSWARP